MQPIANHRTFRVVTATFAFGFGLLSHGQALLDAFGDTIGSGALRAELGQTLGTDDVVVTGITHYSEGSPIKLWLHDDASVTYSMATDDTIYSVLQEFTGEDFNAESDLIEGAETTDHANYYKPWDAVKDVPAHRSIRRNNVFPDIDAVVYFGRMGPKLSLILQPGSSPNSLQLRYTGQDSLGVDLAGNLVLYNGEYQICLSEAYAFQVDDSYDIIAVGWTPSYVADGNSGIVTFAFDSYNTDFPLILQIGAPPGPEPEGGGSDALDWCTMIGTDNVDNWGGDYGDAMVAADDGTVFVAGNTQDDTYPILTGALPFIGGLAEAYIMKFDYAPGITTDDAVRTWVTYYGGSDRDKFTALRVSDDGTRLYGVGWSASEDLYLTANPNDGTYWQGVLKGSTDGFLTTFDLSAGELERATYFGGNDSDMVTSIVEDIAGRIIIAGTTKSATGAFNNCNSPTSGFPLCDPNTGNYLQNSKSTDADCFIAAFDDDYTLYWSTFYGDEGRDVAYDLAYYHVVTGPVSTDERLILVGSTTETMPQSGSSGDFQQNGNGLNNGFIATFKMGGFFGDPDWTTNLNGLKGLFAVTTHEDRIFVLGVNDFDHTAVVNVCTATANSISICNPGGLSPWVEDVANYYDHYLAEFQLPNGEMLWGTFFGGAGDESADWAVYRYPNVHPFGTEKLYDLACDEEGNLFMLGMMAQIDQFTPATFPTEDAPPFYYQPYNQADGNKQSSIVVACFVEHSRFWATTFGSRFDHIGPPENDLQDEQKLGYGADYGHNIAIVEGEAVYWAGSTGGWDFDDRCPYPGTSYCELSIPFGSPFGDPSDAFVARMSLVGLEVGVNEGAGGALDQMVLWPNPATNVRQVSFSAFTSDMHVVVTDAMGRVVLVARPGIRHFSVLGLATGLYQVAAVSLSGESRASTRLLVQH